MRKVILSRKAEQVLSFDYCRGKIYVEISGVDTTFGGALITQGGSFRSGEYVGTPVKSSKKTFKQDCDRWYRQYVKKPIYY